MSLRVLGGSDSASPRDRGGTLSSISVRWPQDASSRATADQAGPPPMTIASKDSGFATAIAPPVYRNLSVPHSFIYSADDMDANERLLIEAAQKDPAGFGELYERHFEQVYAFVAG